MPKVSLRARALAAMADPGPRSALEKILPDLPPDLRVEFIDAVNDHTLPARGINRAMAELGYKLPPSSIEHFRRNGRTLS